ncbi:MAG: putative flippase GtrA [Hyphomicrobiaceae bacterium]|jgi:putative flippase GtrA
MTVSPKNHRSQLQHWGGFIAAGLAALAVDAAVLTLLTEWLVLSPYVARLFSISAAMVVSWQINRRVTFAVRTPSSLAEFTRFAAVSWIAQTVNYTVFAVILLIWPDTSPLIALVAASLVAMFVSYTGFRFGVFAKS